MLLSIACPLVAPWLLGIGIPQDDNNVTSNSSLLFCVTSLSRDILISINIFNTVIYRVRVCSPTTDRLSLLSGVHEINLDMMSKHI